MTIGLLRPAAVLAVAAVACGGDSDRVDNASSDDGVASVSASGGDGDGSADDGSDGADGGDDGGTRYDVPGGVDVPAEEGCQKVDFLFVIDNSISMNPHQEALIASFPGFIDAIVETLSAKSDYHIMVVDTDGEGKCSQTKCDNGTANQELCHAPESVACTATYGECDLTVGAGVLFPTGQGATNHTCTVFGGNRYMIEGEPDLHGTFACTALVGLAGHAQERPMDALVAAVSPALNDAGGCNEGFLRDDAILVVTFVTNDPKYEDTGVPTDWYDAVVQSKNGDPSAVVVLGLLPDNAMGCKDGGGHWREFVSLFGSHGLHDLVCAESYTPFFEQAIALVDTTCDEFDPPG